MHATLGADAGLGARDVSASVTVTGTGGTTEVADARTSTLAFDRESSDPIIGALLPVDLVMVPAAAGPDDGDVDRAASTDGLHACSSRQASDSISRSSSTRSAVRREARVGGWGRLPRDP